MSTHDPLPLVVSGCYRAGQMSIISRCDALVRPISRRTSGNPVGGPECGLFGLLALGRFMVNHMDQRLP